MRTIIFINTQRSGSSREAIEIAKSLGYKTVLLTKKISHIKNRDDFSEVDDMILCDIDSFEDLIHEIKQVEKQSELVGIISFIDPYVHAASILSEDFNLSNFTAKAINKMQNKKLSRECIKHTPYAPWFKIIRTRSEIDCREIMGRLPLIVKNPRS